MPASLGFMVEVNLCSVRSNCLLYPVVVSIVVLSHPILCLVVREWWPVGSRRFYVVEVSRVVV